MHKKLMEINKTSLLIQESNVYEFVSKLCPETTTYEEIRKIDRVAKSPILWSFVVLLKVDFSVSSCPPYPYEIPYIETP